MLVRRKCQLGPIEVYGNDGRARGIVVKRTDLVRFQAHRWRV
jgi:hypothetical protein